VDFLSVLLPTIYFTLLAFTCFPHPHTSFALFFNINARSLLIRLVVANPMYVCIVQISRSQLVMRERKCDLSGARKNSKAMAVSKSNAHTHRVQHVNLQTRKLWWEEGNKFVRIRVSTKTLKTIQKNGLNTTAKKYGVDLNRFSLSSGSAPLLEDVVV
jgi:large subunit ribosomal protein L28